jgi:hypothetical protein
MRNWLTLSLVDSLILDTTGSFKGVEEALLATVKRIIAGAPVLVV